MPDMIFAIQVPVTGENFVRNDIVGTPSEETDPLYGLGRRIVKGDHFLGVVDKAHDRTGLADGVLKHDLEETGTINVRVGFSEMLATSGLTDPKWGVDVYADSPTTFDTDPTSGGTFMGTVLGPWRGHPGFWFIDTMRGYMRSLSWENNLKTLGPFQYGPLSTAKSEHVVSPFQGFVHKVHAVLTGAVAEASGSTLTTNVSGSGVMTAGDIVVGADAVGTTYVATPTDNQSIDVGESVEIIGDGSGTAGTLLNVTILIRPN